MARVATKGTSQASPSTDPTDGGTSTHSFNAVMDAKVSRDGGTTFQAVRASAARTAASGVGGSLVESGAVVARTT